MIVVYFQKDEKSKRRKVKTCRTFGEAANAAVDYARKNRIPMDNMHHYKENGYDVYDLGIWGKIIIITE